MTRSSGIIQHNGWLLEGQIERNQQALEMLKPHQEPTLYGVYNAVQEWLRAGGDTRNMRQFGIDAWQMEGADNYGNVQFTGYYTPVIQARHTRKLINAVQDVYLDSKITIA